MPSMQKIIEHKLRQAFMPIRLRVIDESSLHIGHSGGREGGETHFRIEICAPIFAGLTRLECHRHVVSALAEETDDAHPKSIHALAIRAYPPT